MRVRRIALLLRILLLPNAACRRIHSGDSFQALQVLAKSRQSLLPSRGHPRSRRHGAPGAWRHGSELSASRPRRAVVSLRVASGPEQDGFVPKDGKTSSRPAIERRQFLRRGVAALSTALMSPQTAHAIVKGDSVTDAEAAAAGVVGLYIDLSGCTICRKGVPATCTGTLIAPDLVLSAQHCNDVPRELNGTLERVVFGADMLKSGAPSREIEKYVSTSDYGIETAGNDLLLIKMKGAAPAPWRPVELPLQLLPSKAELGEAEKAGNPLFPDGIGMPQVVGYGYGQQTVDGEKNVETYSAGELKRIGLQVRTEVRPWAPGFLTTPIDRGAGTCAGDSGGGALVGISDPQGRGLRQLLLGVQSAASKPCVDNQAIFIYPQAFADFLTKASRDLGSPVAPGLSWRDLG